MDSYFKTFWIVFLFSISMLWSQFDEAIETNWDGLTVRLIDCHQDHYKLFVKVEFENSSDKKISGGKPIYFKDIYLLDPDQGKKYFVLKDAEDLYLAGPSSDHNDGGRWWINVPAQSKVFLWAFFTSLPSEDPLIDVVIPEIFPFESVEVATRPFEEIKQHITNAFPNEVNLISARRSRGAVSTRLRLVNQGSNPASTGAIFYESAYLYDYVNQRKYPVLKDNEDHFIAEPKSDLNKGGRWWTSSLKPGHKQLMSLKFQAPPDSVSEVSLIVPLLVPFERVNLTGRSRTQDHSGLQVLGAEIGVQKILKDLQAEESENEIKIRLSSEVLFDHDQSNIRDDAEPSLNNVLAVIREYQNSNIRIEGHTDNTGTDRYNLTLSEKRAEAVKKWFIDHGTAGGRLFTKGLGESEPVASNDTPEGRQLNRRVELVIEKGVKG